MVHSVHVANDKMLTAVPCRLDASYEVFTSGMDAIRVDSEFYKQSCAAIVTVWKF